MNLSVLGLDKPLSCPKPLEFLGTELSHDTRGYVGGRVCIPYPPDSNNTVTCCLPCPLSHWFYPDGLDDKINAATWIGLPFVITNFFLFLSYIFLPSEYTRRHFVNVGAVASLLFIDLGYLIPLGVKPQTCANSITSNDMTSDVSCAFSGAFMLFGGLATVLWGFARTLLLHLQIVWGQDFDKKIQTMVMVLAWVVPGIFLVVSLAVSGVSYRVGRICFLNTENNLVFWVPMLVFSCLALLLQFSTMVYSSYVYLRAVMQRDKISRVQLTLPTHRDHRLHASRQQLLQRIKNLLILQWRGIVLVLCTVANVLYLCVEFLKMNKVKDLSNDPRTEAWFECLIKAQGDKDVCLPEAEKFMISQAQVVAIVAVLAICGFWSLVLFVRFDMVRGWWHLLTGQIKRHTENAARSAREQRSRVQQTEESKQPINAVSDSHSDLDSPTLVYCPTQDDCSTHAEVHNEPQGSTFTYSHEMEVRPPPERPIANQFQRVDSSSYAAHCWSEDAQNKKGGIGRHLGG